MKRRRHTPEQVIRKLAEGDKLLGLGKDLEEVCRHLEITESTWNRGPGPLDLIHLLCVFGCP